MAHTLAPFSSTTLASLAAEIRDRLNAPIGALAAELSSAVAALDTASAAGSFVNARAAIARSAMRDAQVSLERVRSLLEHLVAQYATSAPAAAPLTRTRRPSVLAVDDDVLILRFLRRALRECDIMAFSDPHEALEHLAKGERFDVILSDVNMPTMTGHDFYAEVRRRAPEQADRFAFVTSGATTEAAQKALEEVGRPVLIKPFALEALRSLIHEACARRERARD